jgi:predicted ATPase
MLGCPDRAPGLVQAEVDLTHELGHRPSVAFALATSLIYYHYARDVARVLETAEQLLALVYQEGFEIWSGWAMILRGWAMTERGRVDEGIADLCQGLAMWQATGNSLNQPAGHGHAWQQPR